MKINKISNRKIFNMLLVISFALTNFQQICFSEKEFKLRILNFEEKRAKINLEIAKKNSIN